MRLPWERADLSTGAAMQALRHKPPSAATEISGVSAGHDRDRSGCRAGVSNYLTDGNDTYTTDGKFDVILALKGNDKITIQKVFYDVESDVTRITVYGGPGDDQIISKIDISGQVAYGGPGNDTIVMRGGDDLGGAGTVTVAMNSITCIVYQEPCFADGGAGQDTLISQSETSTDARGRPEQGHADRRSSARLWPFWAGWRTKG